MENKAITQGHLERFAAYLLREEKSTATQEKYLRDVKTFAAFLAGQEVTKELVRKWKEMLRERFAVRSVNAMLASINSFLDFMHWSDCKVKSLRLQRQVYSSEKKELTKEEYRRLLQAAGKNDQLYLLLQTICATGIRVSELPYFTVEAVQQGEIRVSCKNKTRTILVPGKLKKLLLRYARQKKITGGTIFQGKQGKPLNRSSVWRKMKQLCASAGVAEGKVFPHNLRKLFARSFYALDKDIAQLADILGHSSIDTTRIYIMTTGTEHRRKIEKLGLVV